MKNILIKYLETLATDAKQSHDNLTVFPLLSDAAVSLAYLMLDEALQKEVVEVAEVDESGEVSRLKVINRSDLPVLILDGEELVGAKQNRIVNTTILIAAESMTIIPVSCVEQGRWTYRTNRFFSEKRMMTSRMRASKAVKVQDCLSMRAEFAADQGSVWQNIREMAERRNVDSLSGAMADIYEKERPAIAEYLPHFHCLERQVGAVFAIAGQVVGFEAFGKSDTFATCFDKIVESYVLDAIDEFGREGKDRSTAENAGNFLRDLFSCRVATFPSAGLGTDCRLDSEKANGLALVVDGEVLHLSVFARQARERGSKLRTRLSRPSRRRRRMVTR
jgi:hypothetical protein